ncbi:hypothetical protein [Leptobacterium sp. I13]|uniref:hypothetical protein n=1 Tax=Leptobacterium meishanense TaxID=3128904 RepID=UPI0030EBED27
MKKIIVYIPIAFSLLYQISAQVNNSSDMGKQNVTLYFDGGIDTDAGNLNLSSVSYKEPKRVTEGDVYLFSKWEDAELYSKTGKKYKILGINYNVKNDRFEIKVAKDSVFVIAPNYIDYVDVNDVLYKKYDKSVNNLEGYYEIVYKGNKLSLLKKHNVRLVKGKMNPLNGIVDPDKYYLYYDYYIQKVDQVKEIILKEKTINKFLGNKIELINKYVKSNNLSYKKEKDIIRILEYYDSL